MDRPDYIVVGGGSAGCALTNRLVDDPRNCVLLLEAGSEDKSPLIHMPRGFPKLLSNPKTIWRYPGDPEVRAPETFWLRGRMLGGSSSINGQVYMRGRPAAYDGLNVPGWGWAEVSSAFEEMENHELGAAPGRGGAGPLRITVHAERNPVCDALIKACVAEGGVEVEDLNQEDGLVAGYQPRNIYKGRRQSASTAFLKPIRSRPNLQVVTDAEVLRIVFEGRRAVGVELKDKAGVRIVRATKEVILSAGALNTPKLLMLSGVGPADTLRKFGVEVLVDRPQVGQNLVEQLGYMPIYRLSHGSDNHKLRGLGILKSLLQYVFTRKGTLSDALFIMSAMVSTRPGANQPNAMFQFTPASAVLDKEKGSIAPEKLPGATLSAYVIQPRSRGYITLTSADPHAPMYYQPNYFADEEDRRDSIDLVRKLRKIFSHPAVKAFKFEEVSPGPEVETDDQIADWFLKSGAYAIHGLGTCRMGPDADSVVDTRLRVRGVEGLRIADTSVLPEMVSSHSNAPAMMIGWRAGQIIRQDAAKAGAPVLAAA